VIKRKLLFILLLHVYCFSAYAQYNVNKRSKQLFITSDTIQLDTLSLVPGSVTLKNNKGNRIDTADYKVNYAKGIVIFKKKLIDSLQIIYQTFPYLFSGEAKHKKLDNVKPDFLGNINSFSQYSYTIESQNNDIFKMEGLDKSGSISRGISFGNTQNMSVNSNLNLQLSGRLNNDVEILLAATDSNIPIQPEGNTQNLQEFDKVFIQLSKDKTKLIAGDFQMNRPNSYFMNFYKKSQGLSFSTVQNIALKDKEPIGVYRTTVSAGVSRGTFSRNKIQGIEGNQGPYRLQGVQNESYIIVLSGTERVYIDGKLLTRGQENDYVIDYNTATIRFTAKQLITKDKRIVVEFQYSQKNYARSLLFVGNDFEMKRLKLHLNVYSEQDSKNQPLQQSLSDAQKKRLSQIGDTLSKAFSPGYDSIAFDNNQVLYKKVDTIVNAVKYSVFEQSTNSDSAHWRVTFSNVGQGNGDYIQVASSANGAVFQWIAPDAATNKHLGNYNPVVLLITPKQKQMLTAGFDYALSRNTKLSVEGVVSNNNVNTFSTVRSKDAIGSGIKMNVINRQPLTADTSSKGLTLISNANYEYVQKNFSPIERYRAVEFERDWNRASTNILNDQQIVSAGLQLAKKEAGNIGYNFNSFFEGNNYKGVKHNATAGFMKNGFTINYNGSLLNVGSATNSAFYRHKSDASKIIKAIKIGYTDVFEQNKFTINKKDSLLSNSYQFWEWQGYAQNADTTKSKYGVYYKQRSDDSVKSFVNFSGLRRATLGKSYGAFLELTQNPNNMLKINTAYRTLQILDSTITRQNPDNTVVSRVEYTFNLAKGFIRSNSFYEIGSGLEVKQQYAFLEVVAGQGVYIWNDYNENGVKELNEFEVATFPGTANYVKVYTPTNSYIKVYRNQFSQQLMIKPAALWPTKTGMRKFISRFANQTTYRADRKSTGTDYLNAYNPFLPESEIINNSVTLNSSFRNTFFINQLSPVFGLDLTYQNNKNISLLVNGIDKQQNTFNESIFRWNITKFLNWGFSFKNGKKSYESQYLETRNYSIVYYEVGPKLSYQPTTAFRITVLYKYSLKSNLPKYGTEQAVLDNYGLELKYNILQKGSLNIKANYIQIQYNGAQNTSLSYEMLEALQIGENMTWGATYQRNLSNNMQLSFTYDGHKSSTSKIIHTGGAQVRAYF
jgi:hypothetical protein